MDAMQFPDDSGHGTSRWLPLYHGLLLAALGTGIAIGAAVCPATPSEAAPAAWRINPSSRLLIGVTSGMRTCCNRLPQHSDRRLKLPRPL